MVTLRPGTILYVGLISLASCYYDKEEILYPGSISCDTVSDVSFQGSVMPILDARCNNCHGGTNASGGIRLDSFTETIKYVGNGSLVGSISHSPGFSAMPKNSVKMSDCEISKIQGWIKNGAANN